MGQVCVKLAVKEDEAIQSRQLNTNKGCDPTICLKNSDSEPALLLVNSDDEEDAFYDAADDLSLEDVIEEWRLSQHGSLGDLTAEVGEALEHGGGHLIPHTIEVASKDIDEDTSDTSVTHHHHHKHGHIHHIHVQDTSHEPSRPSEQEYILPSGVIKPPPPATEYTTERIISVLEVPAVKNLLATVKFEFDQGKVLKAEKLVEKAAQIAKLPLSVFTQQHQQQLETSTTTDGTTITNNTNNNNSSSTSSISLQQHEGYQVACQVLQAAKDVEQTLKALNDDDGWLVSRDKGLRVLYRHIKGSTCHSLKFRAVFSHTPGHIVALAHEWDLQPTWNRFCIEALKLAEPTIFESYVYGVQWMPKPFRHVGILAHARAYDLADEYRSLLITIQDVGTTVEKDSEDTNGSDTVLEQEEDRYVLPKGTTPLPDTISKRNMASILKGSCIKLRPLPRTKDGVDQTEAFLMAHIDPHIPYVPGWLINFVLGVLAPYVYNQMKKLLDTFFANPDGVFPTRIKEQPEVYGRIKSRMEQYGSEYGLEESNGGS